jgi:hypothetical protein
MSRFKSGETELENADEGEGQTIENDTGKVDPPSRINLSSLRDVRLELASVYRAMKKGKIDPAVGTKLTYVLTEIGRVIEAGKVEPRLRELEEQARILAGGTLPSLLTTH